MTGDAEGPLQFYRWKAEEARDRANGAYRQYQQSRVALAVVVLATVFLSFQAFRRHTVPMWAPLLSLPFAGYMANEAEVHLRRRQRAARLRAYFENGIARIERDWEALEEGREYIASDHLYERDLDLFGAGSMYQLLCSARTQSGRDTLARWMKVPASREEVLARQAAIAELRGRQDLREALALAGDTTVATIRKETFESWLTADFAPFPRWPAWIAPLLGASVVTLGVLYLGGWLPVAAIQEWAIAVLGVEGAIGLWLRGRVRVAIEAVRAPSIEIPLVGELLRIVEWESFSSARLIELKGRLDGAATQVARLRRLTGLLDRRRNEVFTVASYFLLWGTQFSMAIDKWRRQHGAAMRDWLAALGEFEALVSLGTYAYEHPRDPFAELIESGPLFDAEGMGHPLLDGETSVRNDVRFDSSVRFLIVSGSNMSGKSTFLRAVGLNAVMAWMGAPVRCSRLRISALRVGAAMRVQDSVTDGRSKFLAEMERLRRLIEAAGEGPLLFLADEVLSGTNSHDRRIAAEWVVRALVSRGAIGAVTTHDLALTEIAANGLPGGNVHFTDAEGAGNLDFDYKLRAGLLQRSNALHIAHMLGIDAFASGS